MNQESKSSNPSIESEHFLYQLQESFQRISLVKETDDLKQVEKTIPSIATVPRNFVLQVKHKKKRNKNYRYLIDDDCFE